MAFSKRQLILSPTLLLSVFLTLVVPGMAEAARSHEGSHSGSIRAAVHQRSHAARLAARRKQAIVTEALRQRGARYVWGGASRGAFDCSGFTRWVFKTRRGIELPHSASGQARLGKVVSGKQLKPGDLVFFQTYRRGICHVGIYIGARKFVHAANSRKGVRVDRLDTGYYAKRLKLARRIP